MKNKEVTSSEWMKIRNEADGNTTIDIEGYIGWDKDASWPEFKKKLIDAATNAKKKLTVNIFSLGGFVDDGLMIHDALRMTKVPVTTRAFSFVASAATIIAQAGDVRQMSKNALYLIHKSQNAVWGNVNQLESVINDMKVIDDRILDLYARRSKVDKKIIWDLMEENDGTGKWINAEDALKYGLIDEILEPSKAVAMVDAETMKKYNLPPIPEEMTKNLEIESDAPETKKGILNKIAEFLESMGLKIGNDDTPEEKPVDNTEPPAVEPTGEPVNTDPAPATNPIPEIPVADVPEEKVEDKIEDKIETNPEADILKLENVRLQKEVEDLKASLSEAESKLAKAGAQSTKPGGVIGMEDPDNTLTENQKSWNEDAKKLVEMFTFANTVKTNKTPKE